MPFHVPDLGHGLLAHEATLREVDEPLPPCLLRQRVLVEIHAEPRDALVDPPLVERVQRHLAGAGRDVDRVVAPVSRRRVRGRFQTDVGGQDVSVEELVDTHGLHGILDQEPAFVDGNNVEVGTDTAGGSQQE